mmetsp:Transcript_2331/g.6863  ORF Transcript_2331/g.6863 Transcript_2331/m.6863 type:complete len:211 (+) Transcript_2331:1585-2217(+)
MRIGGGTDILRGVSGELRFGDDLHGHRQHLLKRFRAVLFVALVVQLLQGRPRQLQRLGDLPLCSCQSILESAQLTFDFHAHARPPGGSGMSGDRSLRLRDVVGALVQQLRHCPQTLLEDVVFALEHRGCSRHGFIHLRLNACDELRGFLDAIVIMHLNLFVVGLGQQGDVVPHACDVRDAPSLAGRHGRMLIGPAENLLAADHPPEPPTG